ncbi:MAG TPA: DUF2442 domain-containing protein [Opitutaceae bacterium]|jgi:hypothetical protein|nr:DUF2442 domain-containing protein [Opitutaceae bacterium]
MKTKFAKPGKSTSAVEVTHISKHGIWVLVGEKEYLLTKEDFPWFADGKISEVANVELLHGTHLRWPDLDVDIELESLEYPDRYPLVYK